MWFLSFGVSFNILGMEFSEDDLERFLAGNLGKRKRALIGPMLRMYSEPSSFKKAGTIIQTEQSLRRQSAPILAGFANGYAAVLLTLWEIHFSKERQVIMTDFETETYFQWLGGWNDRQYSQILDMLEDCGALKLDKQMHPWILDRRAESQVFWRNLYDELA